MKSPITTSRCERCGHLQRLRAKFCSQCGSPIGSGHKSSSGRATGDSLREAILVAGARCTATKMPFANPLRGRSARNLASLRGLRHLRTPALEPGIFQRSSNVVRLAVTELSRLSSLWSRSAEELCWGLLRKVFMRQTRMQHRNYWGRDHMPVVRIV